MKLLLHACCAPCSVMCVETLAGEGLRPELYWYNPNIHPYTEYRARRDCLAAFAGDASLDLISEDEYGLRLFIKEAASVDFCGEPATQEGGHESRCRCARCYRLRLEKTARFAAAKGYAAFSTTLLVSPYQNHGLIREIAEGLAAEHGVEFLYRDYRPFFREGQSRARAAGYYMQKYCGCIYSEEERYLGKREPE